MTEDKDRGTEARVEKAETNLERSVKPGPPPGLERPVVHPRVVAITDHNGNTVVTTAKPADTGSPAASEPADRP